PVPVRDGAAPGPHRRRGPPRLPLPHRAASSPAQARPAEVPRGTGDRRRQLPLRHVARGQGRRAQGHARAPLPGAGGAARVIEPRGLRGPVRRSHDPIRDAVGAAFSAGSDGLARVEREAEGDTIYAVDRVSEEKLLELVHRELAPLATVLVIAEGLPAEGVVVPAGRPPAEAALRVVVDPIDGTRGLMYQKRSGWILTGVAPNRTPPPTLRDVVLAVQTEIPLVKQHLSDTLWAVRGEGAHAERTDRTTGARSPLRLEPSRARTIAHGFAMVSRFFPGAREELAAIDEEIVAGALGPVARGKAHCFEDQYICTGGQL